MVMMMMMMMMMMKMMMAEEGSPCFGKLCVVPRDEVTEEAERAPLSKNGLPNSSPCIGTL